MKQYFKNIIFSKTPLKGQYRFRKEFHIFPADLKNIPQNPYAKHFPLIIKIWYDDSICQTLPDRIKEIQSLINPLTNQTNRIKQITNLLSALSNHRIFNYDTDGYWGVPMPTGEIPEDFNNKSAEWILSLFTYPGMSDDLKIENHKNPSCQFVPFIEHKKYFIDDPFDNSDSEIKFSDKLDLALKGYFSLDILTRKKIDSATHLICNGIDTQYKMKSLSFISLVSSIETLVDIEFKDKNNQIEFVCRDCNTIANSPFTCHKCNRPIWGIAVKFREFLKKYISSSTASEKKFKKIYSLRSRLVHNGQLLLGDNQIDWNIFEDGSQNKMYIETLQLCRISLMNWLILNSKEK